MRRDDFHAWLIRFDRDEDIGPYFDEVYGDDDRPINGFAAGQGQTFYDHDWIEIHTADTQQQLIAILPPQYRFIVERQIDDRRIVGVDHLVLFHDSWPNAVSVDGSPRVWYLGEFNEQRVRVERTPPLAEFEVEESWWTEIPATDEQRAELEQQAREGFLPASAKLGFMAATGIGGDEDSKLSRAHFDRVSPYPELLHRCLVANAEAGSRTAWFELWRLHERSFDESISPTDRIGYLEMAAEAGDAKARTALASLLMYSWLGSKFGMQRDHQRAERLLLANEQDGVRVDHQLYCLYSMSGPLKDGTKAIHWKSRDAERGHPTAFATLARLHADASGGETDRMLVARCLYLQLCQSQSPIKSDQLRLLEQCTEEEIREGRAQARAWIRDHGSAAPAFGGELRDPFER